ncbi:MAG: flagellar basal body rod protein FlgB [Myxococcota bacterium]
MAIEFDPLVGGLQRVLDLRMAQHSLTATNLANADTPGFKAKVIDFTEVLAQAVEPGRNGALQHTDPRHFSTAGGFDPSDPAVVELEAPVWAADGNSVLPERETARLSENALMYEAVTKGLTSKLALLRYAVSDGRA